MIKPLNIKKLYKLNQKRINSFTKDSFNLSKNMLPIPKKINNLNDLQKLLGVSSFSEEKKINYGTSFNIPLLDQA